MDDLAKDLGALPDVGQHMTLHGDHTLGFKLLFGSTMSAQYLLRGDNSSPAAAIDVLKSYL